MKINISDAELRKVEQPTEAGGQLCYWDAKLAGFGAVVARQKTSFVVNRRIDGKLKRETIGHWKVSCGGCGAVGCMSPVQARQAAQVIMGKALGGEATPGDQRKARKTGPTLADATDLYIKSLVKAGCRPSSIRTVQREIGDRERGYLRAWLDRPLASITGIECVQRHESITIDNGPHVANRVMRNLRTIWRHVAEKSRLGLVEGLPTGHVFAACTVDAVTPNRQGGRDADGKPTGMRERRREPVSASQLPAWYAAVQRLSPVRRDYYLLVALTGLRRNDAATIRWEHVNLTADVVRSRVFDPVEQRWVTRDLHPKSIFRPAPKNGADAAFDLPLSDEAVRILTTRRDENRAMGSDDGGWVFPSVALKSDPTPADLLLTSDERDERKIKHEPCELCPELGMPAHAAGTTSHLVEPKESNPIIVAPHRLRDTFVTSCDKITDPPLSSSVVKLLVNHKLDGRDVTDGYKSPAELIDVLRDGAERVARYLTSQWTPPAPTKGKTKRAPSKRRHLQAV